MCYEVVYEYKGHLMQTCFANESAYLPVLTRKKTVRLLPWGRHNAQPGELPFGGWAYQTHIKTGKWDPFFPKPVLLPIKQFSEYDNSHTLHSYDISQGQYVQGLLARAKEGLRVYIVTIMPEGIHAKHPRWPHIVNLA